MGKTGVGVLPKVGWIVAVIVQHVSVIVIAVEVVVVIIHFHSVVKEKCLSCLRSVCLAGKLNTSRHTILRHILKNHRQTARSYFLLLHLAPLACFLPLYLAYSDRNYYNYF